MAKFKVNLKLDDFELAFDSSPAEYVQFLDLENSDIVIAESGSAEAEAYELGEHYLPIPLQDSRDGYADMQEFIGTVEEHHLRELLEVAIQGKGAFRRFKDTVARHPDEQDRWYAFEIAQLHARIKEWLDSEDIELI